jgi:REP element-mobilizing transposase RayT
MNGELDLAVHTSVYPITFTSYGTRLHGDVRGTVDRAHARPGQAQAAWDPDRAIAALERMRSEPMVLGRAERATVDATVRAVCAHRGWSLLALSVRTNHVHAVIAGKASAERMMNDLKAYATRRLVEAHLCERGRRIWTRHGSVRQLCAPRSVEAACRYVCEGQGTDLADGVARGLAPLH